MSTLNPSVIRGKSCPLSRKECKKAVSPSPIPALWFSWESDSGKETQSLCLGQWVRTGTTAPWAPGWRSLVTSGSMTGSLAPTLQCYMGHPTLTSTLTHTPTSVLCSFLTFRESSPAPWGISHTYFAGSLPCAQPSLPLCPLDQASLPVNFLALDPGAGLGGKEAEWKTCPGADFSCYCQIFEAPMRSLGGVGWTDCWGLGLGCPGHIPARGKVGMLPFTQQSSCAFSEYREESPELRLASSGKQTQKPRTNGSWLWSLSP